MRVAGEPGDGVGGCGAWGRWVGRAVERRQLPLPRRAGGGGRFSAARSGARRHARLRVGVGVGVGVGFGVGVVWVYGWFVGWVFGGRIGCGGA